MPTSRPFAYNTGSPLPYTDQVGDIAIGVGDVRYDENYGGLQWWGGPDEDLGYVIAHTVPSGNQPNPLNIPAYMGFWRSPQKTEISFVDYTNFIFSTSFTTGDQCKTYLNTNGYWTSWQPNPNALILYWNIQNTLSYNGSGTVITDLMGDSNGSIFGGPVYSSTGMTKYLKVQGSTTKYIVNQTDLNPYLNPPTTGEEISVFMWVYPTSNGVILSEQGSSTPDAGFYDSTIEIVGGTMKFRVWPLGGPYLSSTIPTPLNNWYFVGFTYTPTTLTCYVNGLNAGSASVSRITPGNSGFGLFYNLGYPTATNMGGGGASTFRFGGMLIYNFALNNSEVETLFNDLKLDYPLGLVMNLNATNSASYPGSGTIWYNLVDGGNNASITNATFTGITGGTFYFDGNGDFVSLNQPIPTGSDYSISAWVYALDLVGARNIVSSNLSPFWCANGTLYAGLGGNYTEVSYGPLSINTWYFVSMSYSDSTNTMTLYVNGNLVNTNTSVTSSYTAQNTFIGSHFTTTNVSFWQGYISQVYIYTSNQSGLQIQNLFNKTKSTYGL